jgi:hypothetical protein
MLTLIAIIGSLLAASGSVPYIIDTLKHKTKPRLITWFTWSLLAGVAAAAALVDGNALSGLFALLGCIATGSIVVVGFRYGDRRFKTIDIFCLCGVIAGLVLWLLFNSPLFAVWAVIGIDFIGLVPTLIHAWSKPREETPGTFAMIGAGGVLASGAIIAGGDSSVTALGYPLYVAFSMSTCALLIVLRSRRTVAAPMEPQESLS